MTTLSYNQLLKESEECFGSSISVVRNMGTRSYRKSMSDKYDYRLWKTAVTVLTIGSIIGGVVLVAPIAMLYGAFIYDLLSSMGVPYYLKLSVLIVPMSAIMFCSLRYLFWPYGYALFLKWGFIARRSQ